MALRDNPYLPLYVQDFLTDEKLADCSAAATGVYIRLMCLMHKSETYGRILLKQKYRQTSRQEENFACQIAKQMPYTADEIRRCFTELIRENVVYIEGDYLCQKRMIKDFQLSEKRAEAGRKGGEKSLKKKDDFASNFAQAKMQANTEIEIENEIENKEGGVGETVQPPENFQKTNFGDGLCCVKTLFDALVKTDWINRVGVTVGGLTPDAVLRLLRQFTDELALKDSGLKSEKDYKSHFVNWLKIEIKKNPIQDEKSKTRQTVVF